MPVILFLGLLVTMKFFSDLLSSFIVDILTCSLCYFIFIGIVYALGLIFGCLIAALLPPRTLNAYWKRVIKLTLFVSLLLVVGNITSGLWGELIYGHMYYSSDYCGIDFLPFFPITQHLLDAEFGNDPHGLLGVTLTQLNLMWLLFTLGTWGITIFLYRLIYRKMALSETTALRIE
jgi:hypothetical protein